jgi:Rap1a immunity proteins
VLRSSNPLGVPFGAEHENGYRIMGACPPEQTTTLQLIRSFVRYARVHRSQLLGNAVVAAFRALRQAYPCGAEHRD